MVRCPFSLSARPGGEHGEPVLGRISAGVLSRPCAVPQMREPGGDGTAGPGDLAGEAAAPATFKLLANPRRGLAGYLAAAAAAAGPVQQMAPAV